jgi:hypothetical protein
MTPKTPSLILAMFTLMCTLPAAGVIPSVIAQEDTTSLDEENLASGIVSDVLDGSGDDDDEVNDDEEDDDDADIDEIVDQDSTDTATVKPNQDETTIDQTDSNEFGDNTAVSIDIDEEEQQQQQLTLRSPPDDGLLSSEDVVFCFEGGFILGILCSDSLEDCEFAQERFENIISECEGFETPPPNAAFCSISEGGKNIKCESRN